MSYVDVKFMKLSLITVKSSLSTNRDNILLLHFSNKIFNSTHVVKNDIFENSFMKPRCKMNKNITIKNEFKTFTKNIHS